MLSIKSLIAGLALSTSFVMSAFAVPVTVNLAPNTAGYVWSFNYTSSEADVAVTGWSNKSSGNKAIAQDVIGRWNNSGVGVENANNPHHAVDNASGDYDALLFSFNKVVDLSGLNIGWHQNDADVSLLAYTGAAPFAGNLNGLGSNWAALLNNGWSVVGNYNRNGNGSFAVNTADVASQYWLVGAYNTAFGTGNGLTKKDDYFKLKAITFEAVEVAESGSLILLMLGLAGLRFARRRAA
ncbi:MULTISPECIES: exosortase-dependent surface protein XDP1 [Cellvibrio]|uniref:PEP-CTERM protein-sorting domain-containing protein n=1 Tax=Cellvibrio fibrivorans TaxID=126350 RepID=A0ABU1USI0_9GAMM|nr:exosortase-dependent surface protein XDP1 [Cellvibrio fibrivorans]MDR7088142.1 hypothetical protein [Cellvibrio fibrivorans]